MPSCGALERSNNPYIESVLEPCVLKNQKGIFTMWVWLERKSWKRAEAMKKIYPWNESGTCVYVCERNENEKCKKCKSPIQKGF